MRIFINELKKLFDWRILLLIVVMGILTWFGLWREALDSYDSISKHGRYGSFQGEMFRLYGETLEPEEIDDFDFPGRYAEIAAEGDAIIAQEPIFAQYGITSFIEYLDFSETMWQDDDAKYMLDGSDNRRVMSSLLQGNNPATIEEWYASPYIRWNNLKALERRYLDYHSWLDLMTTYDLRPITARAAERLLAQGNNSLISDDLMPEFSIYAAVTGIFAILAVMVLTMPPLLTDRIRKVNLLQYSSDIGRKMLNIQFAAALVSALILSAVIVVVAYTPYMVIAGDYWNAGIMSAFRTIWLYDITFGQYLFVLTGIISALCICAVCVAFMLVRYSDNIINAVIKTVPAALALTGLCGISVYMALSHENIMYDDVFRGMIHAPEVIVCCAFGVIAFVMALVVVTREKRVDII